MLSLHSNLTLLLANLQDVPELAAITTRAFKASDNIFPMIWGNKAPVSYDAAAMMVLNPIQTPVKITWKAEVDGKVVGYTRWSLPTISEGKGLEVGKDILAEIMEGISGSEMNDGSATAQLKQKVVGGWETPHGINFDPFMRKVKGTIECRKQDYDVEVDMAEKFFSLTKLFDCSAALEFHHIV